jgi:predicted nuclease of predicted toxin-antitoxin system
MFLLADENFPYDTVAALSSGGHDLVWARSDTPGARDTTLLERAEKEARLLLTLDRDFWQIAMQRRAPISRCGVMLFRLHPATAARLTPLAERALIVVGEEWRGHVIVVTIDRIQMIPARAAF